jgi:hypothetical protein
VDGVANLGELLDEGSQGLPRELLHDVEVDFVARPSVSTFEISRELTAQLFPRWPHSLLQQRWSGVDLQELGRVDTPGVFLWQVGSELA